MIRADQRYISSRPPKIYTFCQSFRIHDYKISHSVRFYIESEFSSCSFVSGPFSCAQFSDSSLHSVMVSWQNRRLHFLSEQDSVLGRLAVLLLPYHLLHVVGYQCVEFGACSVLHDNFVPRPNAFLGRFFNFNPGYL